MPLGLDASGRWVVAELDRAGRIVGLGIEEPPQPLEGGPGDAYPTPPDVLVRPRLSAVSESVRYSEGGAGASAAMPVAPPPVTLPPWLWPPFAAYPIDAPANRLPVTVAPAGSLIVSIDTPPPGQLTAIWAVGFSTTDAAATRLTVRINRQPVPPLTGILGAIGDLVRPTRLVAPILVPPSQELDVLVENIGLFAADVAVRCQGYRYALG